MAICGRIDNGNNVSAPTPKQAEEHLVSAPITVALKAATFMRLQQSGKTKIVIADELGFPESEIRRILNPRHSTKADRLESFIHALGRDITVSANYIE